MNRIHELKLNVEFCDVVLCGDKNFELRQNDRGYQKGDYIKFTAFDSLIVDDHPINKEIFEITYVLSGWGLKDGYVVLGFRKVNRND